MDAHSLELLEFDKIRELVAGYAASSLGKELARQLEPSRDAEKIRADLALVTEMTEALGLGQTPPFGGLHDVRLLTRRASIGSMLTAEQLLEVARRWPAPATCSGTACGSASAFSACPTCWRRSKTWDWWPRALAAASIAAAMFSTWPSRELAQVRQQLAEVDERVQNQIKRLLRDPELRKILRYPNATVSGDHYVLPVAVNHRHKLQGVVHRTSSTGETVFIEPAGVASLSAERAVLKAAEERGDSAAFCGGSAERSAGWPGR